MPTYADWQANPYQYALEDWNTSTSEGDRQAVSYGPGWIPDLLDLRQKVASGQGTPWDREWYQRQADAAMAIPLREVSTLTYNAGEDAPDRVSGGSPDLGRLMLTLQEKLDAGTATPHEAQLFDTTLKALADQNYRASVPQASDAFNPLGDQFFSALGVLGLGATGGLAGGALAAGGLGLGSTLGSLGTLAGVAGTGAGVLGQATEQPWLSQLGLGLGIAGGLAGGLGGLSNLWGSGVNSLTDAAKLASSGGKVLGALGRIPGMGALTQAGSYLGRAGQLGSLGAGLLPTSVTDWSGSNAPLAANVNPGVPGLLSAADMATQRGGGGGGGGTMSEITPGEGIWDLSQYGTPNDGTQYSMNIADYATPPQNWYQDTGQYIGGADPNAAGGGGFWGTLGSLGSAALGFLGTNAGTLGPLASALGGLGAGSLGSNAAGQASAQQAAALNRGIDLQTAQWLQQQANQAPWLQAGQQALGRMQGLSGQAGPSMPGATSAIAGANYMLPGTTPGWTPQTFDAGAYRYTPGQGPAAAQYRYTPGQTPDAALYASAAPALSQGAMPGTQVPTLTGQQVLEQDPGAAFRQSEARKALEGSAAARGALLSGGTLQALQSRSQDLASQEYQNAWARMMGANTEQYGRNWNQYLQNWQQGVTGTQLGLQTNAQNFQQAQAAAALREQVNQVASQQGWSQAQAEAAFREQTAQQASQQGYTQALGAQQWTQGQQQQWQQEQYARQMADVGTRYGWDVNQNQVDYGRQQTLYQQQLAEQARQWLQQSTLAGYGQNMTGQAGVLGGQYANQTANLYNQLGTAQGVGTLGSAYPWTQAIGTGTNALTNLFRGLNT